MIKSKSNKSLLAKMLFLVFLIFGLVTSVHLFFNAQRDKAMANYTAPPSPVQTVHIDKMDWFSHILSVGFIESVQSTIIVNEASGIVSSIDFKDGQEVKAGQLLLTLNAEEDKAGLKAKEAKLPSLKAKYERIRSLYQQGTMPSQEFEAAEANYKELLAQIEELKVVIRKKEIRAPFDGVVGLKNISIGAYLAANTDIVRLENFATMQIKFTVAQADISKISLHQKVSVSVDAFPDHIFTAKIIAIEPAVLQQSGLIEVLASIPNHEKQLLHGMFAKIKVHLPVLKDQLSVPQTAIRFSLHGDTVFVVRETEAGVARVYEINVQLGEQVEDQVQILSGLNPGDEVVTVGLVHLRNMGLVKRTRPSLAQHRSMPQL